MKKRIFKFGAALTAALMICSATAGLAFADEAEEVAPEAVAPVVEETVDEAAPAEEVAEDVETPAEDVEAPAEDVEAPAEDAEAPVEEVAVPLETEDITAEDVAEAAADDPAYDADSDISIGTIAVDSTDANYYNVTVPITMKDGKALPAQVTLFVYDITKILGGGDNTYGFVATGDTTPVGYIDQKASAADFKFKLDKVKFPEGNIMIAKVGGTDIAAADAKSFKLEGGQGPTPEVTYGDVNSDGFYDGGDALLVLQYGAGKTTFTDEQKVAADVNGDGFYDGGDALLILQFGAGKLEGNKFPVEK